MDARKNTSIVTARMFDSPKESGVPNQFCRGIICGMRARIAHSAMGEACRHMQQSIVVIIKMIDLWCKIGGGRKREEIQILP